jgi:hypothetical protein
MLPDTSPPVPLLLAGPAPPEADPNVWTTSPQGLAVETDPSTGAWLRVRLGLGAPDDRGARDFVGFAPPTPALESVLKQNGLFLVGDDPAPFAGFADRVRIADWQFRLNPGGGPGAGSVLIFKFGQFALGRQIENPTLWSSPETFSAAPAGGPAGELSAWIQDCIEAARIRKAGGDSAYDYFLDAVVDDPGWNGIVALDAPLDPLGGLPPQLACLAPGLDGALRAHHVGLNVTKIALEAGGPEALAAEASWFGLVDYRGEGGGLGPATRISCRCSNGVCTYAADGGGPIGPGRVLQLTALFANSAIAGFQGLVAAGGIGAGREAPPIARPGPRC